MDSFRAGNWGLSLQSLEMASEAFLLPSYSSRNPAAGLAFASSIAAGMEYEAVRKRSGTTT